MAVDDVTTVITINMAAGDSTDRQPGAGVEELILDVGCVGPGEGTLPNIVPAIQIFHIDGTNNQSKMEDGNAGNSATAWFRMKMVSDNTNYFRFFHQAGGSGDYAFSVIAIG